MNTIEEIKARIQKYPHVKYDTDRDSISVYPTSDDGFTVSLTVTPDSFTVSFNGWHEDFRSEEDALNCFGFGLSKDCRLKEYRRGSFAYKWTIETKDNGKWVEDSTTGLLIFPIWLRKDIRYLQNDLIVAESCAGNSDI